MKKKIALICLVLVITTGARAWFSAAPTPALHIPLAQFPQQIGQYKMISSQTIDQDVQAVLKADDYIVRSYATTDGKRADVFVAYYASQKAGESMHSPKNCLPGSGWEPVLNDRVQIDGPNGPVEVNRYVVEKGRYRSLILYWYHSGKRIYASEYLGKGYLIADSALSGHRDGAIARIVVPLGPGAEIDSVTRESSQLAAILQTKLQPFVGLQ
jgi:EpsI family protein